jgi:hypothetical protein
MSLPKTATCKSKGCKKPATVWVLWAEGMAVIPACDTHKQGFADDKGNDFVGFRDMGWHSGKKIVEFSPRMMRSLSYLQRNLTNDVLTAKDLPKVNADGSEIVTLKQLQTAMGVDIATAAVYVLQAKGHPLALEAEEQFGVDYFGLASIENYTKKILDMQPGTKRVRLVQTILGARRFGQPRGSIIVDDGQEPLRNIRILVSDVPGYDKVADQTGRVYYIGEEANRWVVRDPTNPKIKLFEGKSDKDAYRWLDEYVSGKRKAPRKKKS